MDLMQFKMPPDKAGTMADAIESHIMSGDAQGQEAERQDILTWLRYRISRWNQNHPAAPMA